jgi:uncharacterized cupredoxin-like copper-binding protein/glucose/arabinose dehydrogenase
MKRLLILLLLPAAINFSSAEGFESVEPLSDNATLVYGDGLAVRLLEHGYFESFLQIADADKKLQIRSLAYTGDMVHYRLRPAKFSAHLGKVLSIWKGTDVLIFFGQNESFDGAAGLDAFEGRLGNYLAMIKSRHPGARITLISPIANEDLKQKGLPSATKRNEELAAYTAAMKSVGEAAGVKFVDLYAISAKLYDQQKEPLTLDGLYLNDRGNLVVGKALAAALRPGADFAKIKTDSAWFKQLAETTQRKSYHVAEVYRPSNGVHYYSVRARSYEYEPEVPHHSTLANMLDKRIWRLAAAPGTTLEAAKLPTKEATVNSKGGKRGTGKMKTVKEDMTDFTVADGFKLEPFASNEEFPDLINPMQIRTGPKGRIWVSTFATYPIPIPGEDAKDKILILEDTDGDGKADKQTVFADNLLLPDGFVFYKDGIIVSVPRKLIWLRDTDGDDQADQTVEVLAGIDDTDTHHGGFMTSTANGRITLCEGVFHRAAFETPHGVVHTRDSTTLDFDPRKRTVTIERQTGAPNPWKISYNSWGEGYQMFGGGQTIDMDYYNIGLPAGSKPVNFSMLFRHDKGCGITAVTSPHFPDDWRNSTISAHLLGRNTVIYTPMKQQDGVYKQSGDPIDLINSPNKAFRPVDLTFGLDGALYVSDFYYPIIGHAQHSVRDKNRDYKHGRVWRLTNTKKPLLKAPKIKGESLSNVLALLTHEQVRVRELARVELDRFSDAEVTAAIKKWLPAGQDAEADVVKLLEAMWTYERRGIEDTSVVKRLLASKHPQGRAMAARSLRQWGSQLGGEGTKLAAKALKDDVPRVRLAAISAASFLQQDDPNYKTVLEAHSEAGALKGMLALAQRPPESRMQPIVPVLAPPKDTLLKGWVADGKGGSIWFQADKEMEIMLASGNSSTINVDVNDLPAIRNAGSNWTKDYQATVKVKKGVNKIHYFMSGSTKKPKKGKKAAPPSVQVSLSALNGKKPQGIRYPKNANEGKQWAAAYTKQYAIVGDSHIYVKTIPAQMAFNVKAFTVKAGKTYTLILENPDITMHNFLVTKPGKANDVGALADALGATPDGLKKHYIPDSDLVLFSTIQVPAGQTHKQEFKAPTAPGEYPFICSFPGHWQLMRGVMTVK